MEEKTEKPKTYIGKTLLGIIFKIKAKLLEPRFFDPSHNGAYLGSYRTCFFWIFVTEGFTDISVQKNRVAISHVNEKNEESKNTANRNNCNIGWPINRKVHGHRSIIVAKTYFNV